MKLKRAQSCGMLGVAVYLSTVLGYSSYSNTSPQRGLLCTQYFSLLNRIFSEMSIILLCLSDNVSTCVRLYKTAKVRIWTAGFTDKGIMD